MHKFLTVLATTSALALVSVAAPTSADARCRGCGVGAGVVGGLAVGAAVAGATSGSYYNGPYDSAPGYTSDQGYASDQGYMSQPGYAYAGPGYAYQGPAYGYRYGGSSCDNNNLGYDQQLQGTC